jgi:hypothetical protein
MESLSHRPAPFFLLVEISCPAAAEEGEEEDEDDSTIDAAATGLE